MLKTGRDPPEWKQSLQWCFSWYWATSWDGHGEAWGLCCWWAPSGRMLCSEQHSHHSSAPYGGAGNEHCSESLRGSLELSGPQSTGLPLKARTHTHACIKKAHLARQKRNYEKSSLFLKILFTWPWQNERRSTFLKTPFTSRCPKLWKKVPFPKHTCDTDRNCEKRSVFLAIPLTGH